MEITQNFSAFSEYMNFMTLITKKVHTRANMNLRISAARKESIMFETKDLNSSECLLTIIQFYC